MSVASDSRALRVVRSPARWVRTSPTRPSRSRSSSNRGASASRCVPAAAHLVRISSSSARSSSVSAQLLGLSRGGEGPVQLGLGLVQGGGERLDDVLTGLGSGEPQLLLRGPDRVIGGDHGGIRPARAAPRSSRGRVCRILREPAPPAPRSASASIRSRARTSMPPPGVGAGSDQEQDSGDDPGPRGARGRGVLGSPQARWGADRASRELGSEPGPRRGQACSAAMAAPAMPAWFSSWAATMSARMSIMCRNLSALRLIPPPTTIRSGENRKSRCE